MDPNEWFRRDRTKLNQRQGMVQGYGSCLLSLLHVARNGAGQSHRQGSKVLSLFSSIWHVANLSVFHRSPLPLKCDFALFDPKETIRDAMVSEQTSAYAAVTLGYFRYTDPLRWDSYCRSHYVCAGRLAIWLWHRYNRSCDKIDEIAKKSSEPCGPVLFIPRRRNARKL